MKPLPPLAIALLIAAGGCHSAPSRIALDQLRPAEAAGRAIELYDTDGDMLLSQAELAASPGLAAALNEIDSSGDRQLDAAELTARMQHWVDRKTALVLLPVKVVRQGKPLSGALVRFVPEPFLGESYGPAEGTTDEFGVANLAHAAEFRPDPEFPQGVKVGFYRIEVTSAAGTGSKIPAKYNTATVLGQEVSPDAAGMAEGVLTLELN